MKGSLAACIGAVKALVDAGIRLRGDVVVAAVADEEYGSLGHRGSASSGARWTRPSSPSRPTSRCAWRTRATSGSRWRRRGRPPTAADSPRGSTQHADGALPRRTRHASSRRCAPDRRTRWSGRLRCTRRRIDGGSGPQHLRRRLRAEDRAAHRARERPWSSVVGQVQAIVDRLAAADPTFSASVPRRSSRASRSRSRPTRGSSGAWPAARAVLGPPARVRRRHALDGRRAARRGRHRDGGDGAARARANTRPWSGWTSTASCRWRRSWRGRRSITADSRNADPKNPADVRGRTLDSHFGIPPITNGMVTLDGWAAER